MAFDIDRYLLAESTANLPVLHIDPEELTDLVESHGVDAELRRSLLCPCARRETRTPRADCQGCHGTGRLYPEHMTEPVIVSLTGRNPSRSDYPAGYGVHGDVQMTFPAGILPGRGDMVLPLGEVQIVDQFLYLTRQDADQHVSDYAAEQGLTDLEPVAVAPVEARLLHPESVLGSGRLCVVAAYAWRDGPKPVELTEGLHYIFDGNLFVWLGDGRPNVISVRYRAPAAYLVEYDPAKYRQEAGTVFPFRCVGQRIDKWGERDLR